jgi:Zn ribbon nucleic-acid-binding protein
MTVVAYIGIALICAMALWVAYVLGYAGGYGKGQHVRWGSIVQIICPKCGEMQHAAVTWGEPDPYPTYVHECIACGYIITESEWDEVKP